MNYNYFADKCDKIRVLDFIFNQTDLQIFDLGSKFGEEICQYQNLAEITSKFDLERGDKFAVTFQMYSPSFKGKVELRKIDLDPKHSHGQSFRYSVVGLGLIQLYFGGLKKNELYQSHIGHLTEKKALQLEHSDILEYKTNQWDWRVIEQTSRKLKYHIHNKLSIRKLGSLGIMEGADQLTKKGVTFR
jgi:hypothetical protein